MTSTARWEHAGTQLKSKYQVDGERFIRQLACAPYSYVHVNVNVDVDVNSNLNLYVNVKANDDANVHV